MNKGWQTKKLSEICKTGSGGTPLSSQKEYYDGGKIPWLLSGEVAQGNVREAKNFITKAGLDNSAAKLFPKDTVLVAMYGATAGQVGILRFEAATNQAVCGILPNDKFVPEFLFYFLLAKKDELVAQATGNAQPNISQVKIKNTEVPVPPLAEQQRIVGLLDEAFAGLATAKANAEKNLQNAHALFESHLQSVFTQRGPGWVETRLAEICERVSVGHVGPTSEFYCDPSEGIPFLRSQNVRPGKLDWEGVRYITKEFHARLRKSQIRFGDLLFVRVGANRGDCCAVREDVAELNCANIVFARPTRGNAAYLERYCQSPPGRAQLLGMTTGSAQGVINTKSVAELVVPMPKDADQEKVVTQLDYLREQTQRLARLYERKLAALEALKKSLLHQAFSGEL